MATLFDLKSFLLFLNLILLLEWSKFFNFFIDSLAICIGALLKLILIKIQSLNLGCDCIFDVLQRQLVNAFDPWNFDHVEGLQWFLWLLLSKDIANVLLSLSYFPSIQISFWFLKGVMLLFNSDFVVDIQRKQGCSVVLIFTEFALHVFEKITWKNLNVSDFESFNPNTPTSGYSL